MNPQLLQDLKQFYPEIILTVALLAVIVVDIAFPRSRRNLTFGVTAIGLIFAFLSSINLISAPVSCRCTGSSRP